MKSVKNKDLKLTKKNGIRKIFNKDSKNNYENVNQKLGVNLVCFTKKISLPRSGQDKRNKIKPPTKLKGRWKWTFPS